jgi:hypothetical protein
MLKIVNKGIARSFAAKLFQEFSQGKVCISEKEAKYFNWGCFVFGVAGVFVVFFISPVIGLITHGKFTEAGKLVAIMYGSAFFFIPISVVSYFIL